MSESKMSDIIKTSLEGIKNFTEMENAIGNPIQTESGVTVIPVSKVSIGFATGGVDLGGKKVLSNQNFGGGGGTGLSVVPVGSVDPVGSFGSSQAVNKPPKAKHRQATNKNNPIFLIMSSLKFYNILYH